MSGFFAVVCAFVLQIMDKLREIEEIYELSGE